jgi:hypothetical protein
MHTVELTLNGRKNPSSDRHDFFAPQQMAAHALINNSTTTTIDYKKISKNSLN